MSNKSKLPLIVCHLADLHLGYRRYNKISDRGFNQREVDVSQAFREAVDRIIQIKPDVTLIAGDVFHTVRPSNAVITFAFKEIKRLADQTKSPVIILAGNHDTPKRVDSGSLLKLFQEVENVYIADTRIEKFVFPKLQLAVTCLPHAVLEASSGWNVRADDNYTYNILLIHAQVGNQFFSDFGGANLNLKQLVVGEWDYIALGHIHVYQEVANNMVYAGATEHTAKDIWREALIKKGFVEIRFPSLEKIFYPLTSTREAIQIPALDLHGLGQAEIMELLQKSIEEIPGGIVGKIVRVELYNLSRASYALLDHKLIRSWKAQALNLTIDYHPPTEIRQTSKEDFQSPTSLKQELIAFCEQSQNQNVITKLCGYLDKLEAAVEAD